MTTAASTRSWLAPPYLLSLLVLAAAAVGLDPALAWLAGRYSKSPIDVRRPLAEFDPDRLPSFRADPGADASVPWGDLDTDQWFFLPVRPRDRSGMDRPMILHATYYSDPDEQIEHTPEICYRAGGGVVEGSHEILVEVTDIGPVPARLLEIRLPAGRVLVLYTLCANGRFYSSREEARLALRLPGDRHLYVAKLEVAIGTDQPGLDDAAITLCRAAFAEALPILVDEFLPTRAAVRGEGS